MERVQVGRAIKMSSLSAHRATVIARWDLGRAMLRTESGDVYEAIVPDRDRDAFDVGAQAFVEIDAGGVLQRWWLARPLAPRTEPSQAA